MVPSLADSTEPLTNHEYDITDDAPVRCPYCDRPFSSERARTFHVGVRHGEACTEAERNAYEAERDDEEYELFTFHLKAAVSVFLIYFLFVFLYALVWAG